MTNIRYGRAFTDTTLTPTAQRDGFVVAYKEAFGGPPYNEVYTNKEVIDDIWSPHVKDGITILAFDGLKVVGFGCAMPLRKSPDDIQDFVRTHRLPVNPARAWYMSEVGVLNAYRNKGIGTALVRHRLTTISHEGGLHYVLRTAAEGSNSIGIYRKLGGVEVRELQDVSASAQVTENRSASTARVYLHGICNQALRKLAA